MELVPKIQYATLELAIQAAKNFNNRQGVGKLKVVAYKCTNCCQYHIGTNGNTIKKLT